MAAELETKEQIVYLVEVCEKARRYDDMVEAMKKLIKLDPNLTLEERISLSTAYKGAMASRRSSWRGLVSIEERTGPSLSEAQQQVLENYREKVQNELVNTCQELLTCINEVLFPKASGVEQKVFYLKMKADYYRYISEVATDEDRSGVVELAKVAYQEAMDTAGDKISATNPTRLGLALNFAVFNYEILNSVTEARKMIQTALDLANAEIPKLKEPLSEEAEDNLRVMKENMDLWKPEDDKPPA
ncbi:hypothetical protein niasHS_014404 [Heterodera schachtii]|uniref:14-3-3 domain-containing protein n=1 Tax=Heterodera schachtii TaxID=97005 RepID=A0ABD2I381_HETSC